MISRDTSVMAPSAQKGMKNWTYFMCYRLSLFQALMHNVLIVQLFLDFHRPEACVSDAGKCVACSLRLLILEYWTGSRNLNGTLKVLRGMDGLFRLFGWGTDAASSGQADPEEQMGWLFGVLRSELPSSYVSKTSLIPIVQLK
jgi:hypothetical protein